MTPYVTNLYLSIIDSIKKHGKLPNLPVTKQNLWFYTKRLKDAHIIKKIGYGVWEINPQIDATKYILELLESTSKHLRVPPNTLGPLVPSNHSNIYIQEYKSKDIRGHAFQFELSIPTGLRNWKKRREFLDKQNIRYKPIGLGGKCEQLYIEGRKLWLSDNKILIYDKSDYLDTTASGSKNYAIASMLDKVQQIEKLLDVRLSYANGYKFKVSKAHYANLRNKLAEQYRLDRKKLIIKEEDGTPWLWIDYSDKIDELEVGNLENSDTIMDSSIKPFFQGLKEVNGFTPHSVNNTLMAIVEALKVNTQHIETIFLILRAILPNTPKEEEPPKVKPDYFG